MLSAPGETVPITRPQSRIRGTARLSAFAVLLVTLLGSALPSFAQTWVANLTATEPTMLYLDTSTSTTWLYVAEHGDVPTVGQTTAPANGGRILRFNLTTGSATPQVVATRGTGPGQFISPDGLLMNATGQLFVADRYLNKVDELSIDATTGVGTRINGFGTGVAAGGVPTAAELRGPVGLARDTSGAIFVTEHGWGNPGDNGNVVSKWTFAAGVWTRAWRVTGEGLSTPYGIAVSGTEIYVSDGPNNRVQTLSTTDGSVVRPSWNVGAIPLGLSYDGGNLWVGEATGNTGGTQRVSRRNAVTGASDLTIGSAGTGPLQFALPFHAVRNAATNTLYVADYNNSRVQVINLAAAADTTAPTVAVTGGTGSASPASFTVTFSENVTGVDASDFTATFGGGVVANGAASVTGSGSTYTVSVPFTASAAGTITLALNANATSTIKDASNNAYAGAATSGGANTATFNVTVSGGGAAPVVSSSTSASATVGTAFNYQITASNSPTSYNAIGLPAGLSVNTTTGAITGTPTTAGNASVLISATNGSGTGSATLTITIASSGGGGGGGGGGTIVLGPQIASIVLGPNPTSSNGTFTVTFGETVTGVTADDFAAFGTGGTSATVTGVTGSGTTYSVAFNYFGASGSLQMGVRTAGTGIANGGGAAYLGVGRTASDPIPNNTGPADMTPPTATITAGTPSTTTVTFTVAFSEAVTGLTAADFTVVGSSGVTGTVGTITNSGNTYTVPVTFAGTGSLQLLLAGGGTTSITDATGNVMAQSAISGVVNVSGGTSTGTPPAITSGTTASATVGTAFNYQITASNSPTSYNATGLPAGLSVSTTTGAITGTPSAAGTSNVTISASNASGTGSAVLTLTVSGGSTGSAPAITSATTASGTAGTAFNYQITASNSPTSYNATGLPAGLSVNTTTGAITGSPTAAGTSSVTISATNANGTGSATLTITVGAAGSAPTITSATTASGTAGTAFSYQITASGSPTSYAATGLTGTGLSINTSTGAITGTPSAAGTITSTISATNANGTGSATLTITVAVAGTPPTISAQSASGAQFAAFNYQVAATGATSYSVVGTPALPAGLSLNATTGVISGTPTTAGSTGVTIRATNSFGSNQAVVTISIAADTTAPTVSGFTVGTSNSTSVNFTLTFSEPVTGVSADDFTVTASSGTTASVSGVTGSGASYTVATSYTGAAGGTVRLTLKSSGTGIADLAGNAYAGGGTATSGTFTIPAGPVVTSTTLAGLTGTAFSYQIQATGNPTSYSSGTLPAGLTLNTSTGLISGTPTTVGNSTVTISATNANGTGTGTLTFQIAQGNGSGSTGGGGGGVSPPVSGGGGGGGGGFTTTIVFTPVTGAAVNQPITLYATANTGQAVTFTLVSGNATLVGNVLTPKTTGAIVVRATVPGSSSSVDQTITAKNGQTITFNSPTSSIQINSPIQLSATSSAGLPITFSVVSGTATISGNTLTPKGPGAIVVRASAAGSDSVAAATADVNFGSPAKASQSLNIAGVNDTTVTAGPMVVIATSSSGLPVTITVSGPARLSGNTLTLTGAPGTVTIRAAQSGNDTYAATEVLRSFAVRAAGQQVFLGTMGSDTFAVVLSQDGSKGVFVTRLAGTGEAIVGKFSVNSDGSFRTIAKASRPATADDVSPDVARSVAALSASPTISGTIANGVVSGSVEDVGTFSANVAPATGSTAALSGVYIASTPGSASGDTYIVAGPNGTAYAVSVTPFGVTSGTGTISADGAIDISTSGGGAIVGSVDASTGMLNGTLRTGNNTAALVGISEGTSNTDRLVNLSSRLRVTGGDASRSVVAGFVIGGTDTKPVLVRAVGPGLTGFGVSDALANPRLQLYNSGGALVAENQGWNNSTEVDDVANRVGAFKLAANSRDSALVANLAPGAYTAVVSGVNGNGVALVEVYDATTNAAISASQQLVNMSTRGFVDTGDGNLIAGFVVAGNAPKRVLIRGIGPSLTQFGVTGAVADPMLKLYAAGSSTPIAQNNDWSTPQSMSATQVAATATEIADASSATGAFPLAANSKDAAIVITLMPGQYSAVVSGANNATGAGLVEVYELSNQ